jgi:hypothetical protein
MNAFPEDIPMEDRLRKIDDLCDHFLYGCQALAPISRERVRLWEALQLMTNVLRSWTRARPVRLRRAYALLRHYEAGLDAVYRS